MDQNKWLANRFKKSDKQVQQNKCFINHNFIEIFQIIHIVKTFIYSERYVCRTPQDTFSDIDELRHIIDSSDGKKQRNYALRPFKWLCQNVYRLARLLTQMNCALERGRERVREREVIHSALLINTCT